MTLRKGHSSAHANLSLSHKRKVYMADVYGRPTGASKGTGYSEELCLPQK